MKVLFAVNSESISDAIIKKYQKDYREILSYKNVYYFNAIQKEIQKDKSYDRIVISEDLEPFSNNNYESIDKFIFEKLDSISDEADAMEGKEMSIILIASDRHTKGSSFLVKIFGIGVYNALLGNDRSMEEVCRLINKPRTKKEAKMYYRIDADDVNYKAESEDEVSELEIKNIISHFKKLGKNTSKYAESFENIASQYTEEQLKIIINCLPITVKAVLVETSRKYQEIMAINGTLVKGVKSADIATQEAQKRTGIKIDIIENKLNQAKMTKPIVIPNSVKAKSATAKKATSKAETEQRKKVVAQKSIKKENVSDKENVQKAVKTNVDIEEPKIVKPTRKVVSNKNSETKSKVPQKVDIEDELEDIELPDIDFAKDILAQEEVVEKNKSEIIAVEQEKKKRGRPRKSSDEAETKPKGKRGRPRKVVEEEDEVEVDELPELEDIDISYELDDFNVEDDDLEFEPLEEAFDEFEDYDEYGKYNTKNQKEQDVEMIYDEDILSEEDENENNVSSLIDELESEDEDIEIDLDDDLENEDIEIDLGDDLEDEDIEIDLGDDLEDEDVDINLNDDLEDEDVDINLNDDLEDENVAPLDTEESEDDLDLLSFEDDLSIDEFENEKPEVDILQTNDFEDIDILNFEEEPESQMSDFDTETDSESETMLESIKSPIDYSMSNLNSLLTKDKKIVTFLGTSKNGVSFLVNSLAEIFASVGINTAILDMTQNKNSYYIYTQNEESLRKIAYTSIENLQVGIAEGIKVKQNLTVYTALPNDGKDYSNAEPILSTLVQNHSLVLVDCDFETAPSYFGNCQEIYLVQSMDILTIQPLTAFLRELKTQGVLEPEKVRVVINKELKVRGLTNKAIIGGMAFYNDPSMSFMTELFNKDIVKYCSIPFEELAYSKYLESILNCKVSVSAYSKNFKSKLRNLGDMVYPLTSRQNYKASYEPNYNQNGFSNSMNDTLNKMKKKY